MEREYKIWDNGNKCTIINEYECNCDGYDNYDYIVGCDPIGFLGCNLKNYDISYNNGNMKTVEDIFNWVFREKKIESFAFTAKELINKYNTDLYDANGEKVILDSEKEYSVEEIKNLIMLLYYNDIFEDVDFCNFIYKTEFEDLLIVPFFAYIHSGISVSLSDYKDGWDSGFAGFAWIEPFEGETKLDVKAYSLLKEDFDIYDDYINGYYNEYCVRTFEKENGEWKKQDEVWDIQKSFEDAWEDIDFNIADEIDNFSEEDYNYVRKEITIGKEQVLDYFQEYLD